MPNQVSAIVATAQKQLDALQAIDSAIAAKIAAIKDAEWDTPLTAEQIKQISDLRAQEAAILSAIEELSYVTVGALDKSDELTRMLNALQGISKDLSARTAAILAIGASAQNISAVCDGISSLVTQIQSLQKA